MTSLYFEQSGTGPELVLVHGWGLHGGIWQGLTDILSADFRTIRIDLPGHGRSSFLTRGGRLEVMAAAVAAAVAGAVRGPATWVGWSLGGLITLAIAHQYPERVKKLVLVASTPKFVRGPDWRHAMEPVLLEQFATELSVDYRRTLLRFLSLQAGDDSDSRTLARRMRAHLFDHGEPSVEALRQGLRLLQDADLRLMLPEIALPVQIIHGDHDRLVPIEAAEYLTTRLPGARLQVIMGAGHAPFLSHQEQFAQQLKDFA